MNAILDIVSWLCLGLGSVLCLIGAVGILRLPDVYTRTHAATITDTAGAGLIMIGLMVQAGPTLTAVKLLLTLLFLLYTSPVAGHALVKAAYAEGVDAPLDRPEIPPKERPRDGISE